MLKKLFYSMVFLMLLLVLLACNGGTKTNSSLSSIEISPANTSILADHTKQLNAIGKYADNSTQNISDSVIWSSSDESVVMINKNGHVTAVSSGTATITALLSGKSSTALLAVKAPGWTLIYANDANGKPTFGNLQTLINAVREGSQVRVGIPTDLYLDGQTVNMLDNLVCVQNTSHVSLDTGVSLGTGSNFMKIRDNPYYAFFTACTTGDVHISRWYVQGHGSAGADIQKLPLKWFVN
jgi:hypothetical protein